MPLLGLQLCAVLEVLIQKNFSDSFNLKGNPNMSATLGLTIRGFSRYLKASHVVGRSSSSHTSRRPLSARCWPRTIKTGWLLDARRRPMLGANSESWFGHDVVLLGVHLFSWQRLVHQIVGLQPESGVKVGN
jgi:hypothetical protein